MRAILAIARVSLVRFLRDRANLFFVFVLPLLIVLMVGLQFAGNPRSTVELVGADTPVGAVVDQALVDADMDVTRSDDPAAAIRRVEDGNADAAVIVSDGDPLIDQPEVEVSARRGSVDVRAVVGAAIDDASLEWTGARVLAAELGGSPAEYVDAVNAADAAMAPVGVVTEIEGEALFEGATRFNLGALTQLVLFTFLNGLTASVYLILTRKLGVARRMTATPTSGWAIVAGETLGKFAVTAFQAVYILVATALLFGVDWGNPLATGTIIIALSLVGTAVGVLLGSVLDNEGTAGGLGVMVSIALGALGGAMVPSELFPETVRRVSRFTPQYWAVEGLKESVMAGGGVGDVANEVGVLAGFAAVLLTLAVFAYRRSILTTT